MRAPAAFIFACLALAACQSAPAEPVATEAWIRLPAVAGRPGAAYFMLTGGRDDAILTGVATPAAARAELHESMKTGSGMMTMQPLDGVSVPAGANVRFAPGGRHVMLFDIAPGLKTGTTVPLTVVFADGTRTATAAKIVGAGQLAPE